MKMETEITAPRNGTVGAVLVSAGDAVAGGQVLVELG
jgi:methylmalonyl-CoA carboxyltransferase small subunit